MPIPTSPLLPHFFTCLWCLQARATFVRLFSDCAGRCSLCLRAAARTGQDRERERARGREIIAVFVQGSESRPHCPTLLLLPAAFGVVLSPSGGGSSSATINTTTTTTTNTNSNVVQRLDPDSASPTTTILRLVINRIVLASSLRYAQAQAHSLQALAYTTTTLVFNFAAAPLNNNNRLNYFSFGRPGSRRRPTPSRNPSTQTVGSFSGINDRLAPPPAHESALAQS